MEGHGPLSDAQYQERVRQVRKRRERQQSEDLRELMKHAWGRRLFYSFVFERGGLHGPSFNSGIKFAPELFMAHNEGRRALAAELLGLVKTECPNQFLVMMAEEINDRQADLSLKREAEKERTET